MNAAAGVFIVIAALVEAGVLTRFLLRRERFRTVRHGSMAALIFSASSAIILIQALAAPRWWLVVINLALTPINLFLVLFLALWLFGSPPPGTHLRHDRLVLSAALAISVGLTLALHWSWLSGRP
ncbi:MAG: hypothetical protein ACFB22_12775 [Rhodothalassiaceae bacterium]